MFHNIRDIVWIVTPALFRHSDQVIRVKWLLVFRVILASLIATILKLQDSKFVLRNDKTWWIHCGIEANGWEAYGAVDAPAHTEFTHGATNVCKQVYIQLGKIPIKVPGISHFIYDTVYGVWSSHQRLESLFRSISSTQVSFPYILFISLSPFSQTFMTITFTPHILHCPHHISRYSKLFCSKQPRSKPLDDHLCSDWVHVA